MVTPVRAHPRVLSALRRSLILLGACLGLGGAACAQGSLAPDWQAATQRWLDTALAAALPAGNLPLRMEVVLGEPDPRLRLAACSRVEPFLPPGTRLWGRTRLGLRCLEGPVRWSMFMPLTVKAFGPAWVVRGDVAQGQTLAEADALEMEVDWAQDASPVLAQPTQWVGQVAARPLSTGQVLRQGLLRPAQVFQAGAQVRVMATGQGYAITSDGQALSTGVVGQPARVRMDNGRILTGVVIDQRTVRLEI
ncbi:MAG: flagellar basal body P-ring formation protein FlgA [Rhodoferax sp.]|nr:flagellar basal body P-ring formation protein FlgA [Rhodoferax sp.]